MHALKIPLLTLALLMPAAPVLAQVGPAGLRVETFNEAVDANTDLMASDLTVYAPSGTTALTTFEVTIALVSTGSVVNLITTQGETSITSALNEGTSVTAGVETILLFRGSSSSTYNLQVATATTLGKLIVAEVRTQVAMAGPRKSASTGQPLDSELTAIGALTPTDSNVIVGNGTTWVAESGATARTSLGLGTGDSPTFTRVKTGDGTAAAPALTGADTDSGIAFGANQTILAAAGAARVACQEFAINFTGAPSYFGGQALDGFKRTVLASTSSATLNASTDLAEVRTNTGAGAEVILSLPTAAAGLTYEVVVNAAQYLQIKASTGDVIRADPNRDGTFSTSADAGYIRSNVAGSTLRIVAIDATTWQVMSETGAWIIDS